MREFIWKIFPPSEVTDFKNYVRDFVFMHQENQLLFPEIQIYNVLSSFADKNIARLVNKIRSEKINVDHFALECIIGYSSKLLKSGEFHTRSNDLKASGVSLLNLVKKGYDELIIKSFMSEEDAKMNLAQLNTVILVN